METKLEQLLKQEKYSYYIENDVIVVNHNGNVYLSSLTQITTDVKFENRGNVYLSSLTQITTDVKFENNGDVYLSSLIQITTDVKFKNIGYVDLNNLIQITTRGKTLKLQYIDGYTMIIHSSKVKDGFKISKAQYLKGGDLKALPKCFIAEKEGYFAHGDTVAKAISDCNFKFLQNNLDINALVYEIKQKKTVSKNEYRLLTGACQLGVEQFCKENRIDSDSIELDRMIELTKNSYGSEKIKELFR